MFAGETGSATCTDSANKELYEKDLNGAIICTPQTVGSTMGAGTVMMCSELGVQPQAWLFSSHIDSISAGGLLMDDVWNERTGHHHRSARRRVPRGGEYGRSDLHSRGRDRRGWLNKGDTNDFKREILTMKRRDFGKAIAVAERRWRQAGRLPGRERPKCAAISPSRRKTHR